MRKTPWATYLWPGLPQLWCDGAWSGLMLAVAFAALLNCMLLASLVWVEMIGHATSVVGWTAVAAWWLGAAAFSWRCQRTRAGEMAAFSPEDLFRDALSEYLKGHWFEAERILNRLLQHDPRDLDARLMLATLLRHAKRFKEAHEQLARLERLEGAEKWQIEIAGERDWLARENPNPADLLDDKLLIDLASDQVSQAA